MRQKRCWWAEEERSGRKKWGKTRGRAGKKEDREGGGGREKERKGEGERK